MKASGIATEVLECARNKGLTLGTAESCTGGLVASALTAIPGSSDVFRGAIVSYANEVKQSCLQVEPSILAAHGAVSRQTALSMATGARNALNADIAVSLTGIAGPGGGMPGKPVGTVWIGVASAQNTDAFCHRFTGGRAAVRDQAVNEALLILKATLDGLGTSHPH
jgi:PncC family amidohydrolase